MEITATAKKSLLHPLQQTFLLKTFLVYYLTALVFNP